MLARLEQLSQLAWADLYHCHAVAHSKHPYSGSACNPTPPALPAEGVRVHTVIVSVRPTWMASSIMPESHPSSMTPPAAPRLGMCPRVQCPLASSSSCLISSGRWWPANKQKRKHACIQQLAAMGGARGWAVACTSSLPGLAAQRSTVGHTVAATPTKQNVVPAQATFLSARTESSCISPRLTRREGSAQVRIVHRGCLRRQVGHKPWVHHDLLQLDTLVGVGQQHALQQVTALS